MGVAALLALTTPGCGRAQDGGYEMKPDQTLTATLPTVAESDARALLERFADEHRLTWAYGFRSPDGQEFLLEMSSPRAKIVAANPFARNVIEISSYKPSASPDGSDTADLLGGLRRAFEAVPGAQVTSPS